MDPFGFDFATRASATSFLLVCVEGGLDEGRTLCYVMCDLVMLMWVCDLLGWCWVGVVTCYVVVLEMGLATCRMSLTRCALLSHQLIDCMLTPQTFGRLCQRHVELVKSINQSINQERSLRRPIPWAMHMQMQHAHASLSRPSVRLYAPPQPV